MEYFRYMMALLQEHNAGHIQVFGGGGGTITLEEIAELIEDGDVRVHIDKVFAMDQVREAHDLLAEGHVRGKLVLDCR